MVHCDAFSSSKLLCSGQCPEHWRMCRKHYFFHRIIRWRQSWSRCRGCGRRSRVGSCGLGFDQNRCHRWHGRCSCCDNSICDNSDCPGSVCSGGSCTRSGCPSSYAGSICSRRCTGIVRSRSYPGSVCPGSCTGSVCTRSRTDSICHSRCRSGCRSGCCWSGICPGGICPRVVRSYGRRTSLERCNRAWLSASRLRHQSPTAHSGCWGYEKKQHW